jgi:hypothetical protein
MLPLPLGGGWVESYCVTSAFPPSNLLLRERERQGDALGGKVFESLLHLRFAIKDSKG